MDKLTALNVFAEVAYRGSFTEAGKNLGLTRSMVSRYINDLEDWLGTRLLQRSTREMSLTKAGTDCLEKAREILDLSSALKEKVGNQSEVPQGTLKVTCAISFGNIVLIPLLSEYMKTYENVNIELILTDRQTNLVAEGIDLAITMTKNLDPNCIAHDLSSCEGVLVASDEYLLANSPINEPKDISKHNCLRHTYFGAKSWSFEKDATKTDINIHGSFIVNDASAIGRAASEGLGIALLPLYVAAPYISSGKLTQICKPYSIMPINIYATYRSRVRTPASLKSLISFLKENIDTQLNS